MEQLTPAEAAYVLETPLRAVKKALDEGPVRAVTIRRGKGHVRVIDGTDLLYLVAVRNLRGELTPKARGAFYDALKKAKTKPPKRVRFSRLEVDVSDAAAEVERRLKRLDRLRAQIALRDDGEPVIAGTKVEAHRIAALLDGDLTVDEVLEDYPSLTRAQVEAARAYADAHPKPGRPYPRTTFKRAMQALGGALLREALKEAADRRDER